jgi:hypothetical protein
MTDTLISEQTEYSSFFFRRDILDDFTGKIKELIKPDSIANNIFTKYKLYNADDILQTATARKTARTRYMEENPSFRKMKVSNLRKTMNYLSKNICEDIGSDYTKKSIVKSMSLSKRDELYDLLVISDNRLENMNLELKDRLAGVVGIIIVELGECNMYPTSYSINLICTNSSAMPGIGSILMGAYLYTILSHPDVKDSNKGITVPKGIARTIISESGPKSYKRKFETQEKLKPVQHIAVLELAFGYMNQGGLCMYEKFGFKHDPDMISEDCFNDYDNLPMIINFNTLSGYSELTIREKTEKVLQISCGNDKGFQKEKICSVRGIDQKNLGLFMFLNYFEEINGTIDGIEYGDENINDIVTIINGYKGVSISDLLNYAENPNIVKTRNIQNIFDEIKPILEEDDTTGGKKKSKRSKKIKTRKNGYKRSLTRKRI